MAIEASTECRLLVCVVVVDVVVVVVVVDTMQTYLLHEEQFSSTFIRHVQEYRKYLLIQTLFSFLSIYW